MGRTAAEQRIFNVRYYLEHRAEEISRVRTRQVATLTFLRDLRRIPCLDCGRTFEPHQMDFDHRDPTTKAFNVTSGRALLKSRKQLRDEIAKCDVVCANCHALRTYALHAERKRLRRATGLLRETDRRNRQRLKELRTRDFILELRDRPCADCAGRFAPHIMQFDHRDPGQKRFHVAHSWTRAHAQILEEAAKCDIVCPNCHRQRTFRRRQLTRE